MKKFTYLIVLTFLCSGLFAQPWMDQLPSNPNLGDMSKSFEQFWQGKTIEKGQGYNQFKRFEYYWQNRVGPNGTLPSNDATYKAIFEEYNRSKFNLHGAFDSGDWVALGPFTHNGNGEGLGRINAVVFHPKDSQTFFVCTPSGGLWKTTNFGKNWTEIGSGYPIIGCSDLAINPINPNVMYVATGDKNFGSMWSINNGSANGDTKSIGLLKTVDGGKTWTTTGLSFTVSGTASTCRVVMHPTDTSIIWVATSAGIYISKDAGKTFSNRSNVHFRDLEVKANNPNVLYAASHYSSTSKVYRSLDGGMNWTAVFSPSNARRIEIDPTPNGLWAVVSNTSGGLEGIYVSRDSGTTFTRVVDGSVSGKNYLANSYTATGTSGQGWYDLCISVNPKDSKEVYVGGVNTWKTTDGGNTWKLATYWTSFQNPGSPIVHADKHFSAFHPKNNFFFSCHDGGIHYTKDAGKTWVDITYGMNISQAYRIGLSVTNSKLFLIGNQDNHSKKSNNNSWSETIGGDGMEQVIDYNDPNYMYSSSQYGNIVRSNDGFASNAVDIQSNISGQPKGYWVTPYMLDPKTPATIYAGYKELYKSTNRGNTWTKISNTFSSSQELSVLAISESDPKVIFTGTLTNLYRTLNGGTTWKTVTGSLPAGSSGITYVIVHPTNPAIVWVTCGNYSAGKKVYRSNDTGNTWTNISGTLPNVPVMCITYEKGSKNGIYIGNDIGIYYRNDDLTDWVYYSRNLPKVPVAELEIHVATKKIRAATYGRGIWESNLWSSTPPTPPKASFGVDETIICKDASVNFFSTSTGNPTTFNWTFAGGFPGSSTDSTPTVTYNTPGKYKVTLIVSNVGGYDTLIKDQYITVNPKPTTPTITRTDNTLKSSGKYGNQWILNGTPITGATDTVFNAITNGTYRVQVTDSNGCVALSPSFAFTWRNLAMDEMTIFKNMQMFPNPASGMVTIQGHVLNKGSYYLDIHDVQGKLISRQSLNLQTGEFNHSLNIQGMAPGVYQISIKQGERNVWTMPLMSY